MLDQTDDLAPKPRKRKVAQNDATPGKRQRIETPGDLTATASAQPRKVIAASVLPAGLPIESRRHVNKWSCFAIDAAGAPGTVGEPKWITERRRLFTSPGRRRPDLGHEEPGATKPRRGTAVTQKSALTSLDTALSAGDALTDLKFNQGFWALHGLASGPVPKGGRRDLQLLNQLSQLLINEIEKAGGTTQEIEAMVVNGRILVSANDQETVDALATIRLDKAVPAHWSATALEPKQATGRVDWKKVKPRKIADVCAALMPGAELTGVPAKVGFRRLIQLQVDCQLIADQRTQVTAILQTLHTTLGTAAGALVKGGKGDALAEKIVAPGYAGRIILVDAVNGSHAEQNLVAAALAAALCSDPSKRPTRQLSDRAKIEGFGPVAVAGGKRPCTTCWLTIGIARRFGLDIHCNWHPGGMWKYTTNVGMQSVATILKIEKNGLEDELAAILTALGGHQQYISDTRADAPREAEVKDLHKAVRSKKGEVSTANDSLSDSEDNDTQTLPPLPSPYGRFAAQQSQPLLYEEVETEAAVEPGATHIEFADTLDDDDPDPAFSVSNAALTDESDATLDELEPISSYPEAAQETEQQPEIAMETETPQYGS